MERFEAIAGSVAGVVLLLEVLRYRQHRLPRAVTAGALLFLVARMFQLAVSLVGIERIEQLVEGRLFAPDDSTWIVINGMEVSPEFILFQSLFNILGQCALLMLALGLLRFLRDLIRQRQKEVLP